MMPHPYLIENLGDFNCQIYWQIYFVKRAVMDNNH